MQPGSLPETLSRTPGRLMGDTGSLHAEQQWPRAARCASVDPLLRALIAPISSLSMQVFRGFKGDGCPLTSTAPGVIVDAMSTDRMYKKVVMPVR
jgi:hypothetical protein